MTWFGESWGSPMNEELEQVETPVGETCIWCQEPVADGDRGVVYSNGPAAHVECFLRQTLGGVAHIEGRCSCYGGDSEPDPPDVTRREAALLAVAAYERQYGAPA